MFGDQIVTIDNLRHWNASSEQEAKEQIADFLR
jgi:phosphoribosylaminoimidazole-succinocarboxamide synthase